MNKNFSFLISLLILIFLKNNLEAKQFTRCQLAKELTKHNIARTFLSNWVCLVENESNRDTRTVTNYPNLSASYGLFQINNRTFCRNGRKAGDCKMKCEDFLDDNIKDDIQCATIIWNQHGFKAWNGWVKKCKLRRLPDVTNC